MRAGAMGTTAAGPVNMLLLYYNNSCSLRRRGIQPQKHQNKHQTKVSLHVDKEHSNQTIDEVITDYICIFCNDFIVGKYYKQAGVEKFAEKLNGVQFLVHL